MDISAQTTGQLLHTARPVLFIYARTRARTHEVPTHASRMLAPHSNHRNSWHIFVFSSTVVVVLSVCADA